MIVATTGDGLMTINTTDRNCSPCPICKGHTCTITSKCYFNYPLYIPFYVNGKDQDDICYCTTEENGMPYASYTKDGQPSFNGIDPKLIKFCGYAFGWHKKNATCLKCNNNTHYSLHRRYKFTANIERVSDIDRIWCCSEECFKAIIFEQLFNFTMEPEEAHKILGLTEE
jgi:hypothetical protein